MDEPRQLPSPRPPSWAQRVLVVAGVALTLGAFVFLAFGLTIAIEQTDSIEFAPGETFHTSARHDGIVFAAVGAASAVLGVVLWLRPLLRAKKAMPIWPAVVGGLLSPVALLVPVAVSAATMNLVPGDVHLVQARTVTATTSTTSPFANCDPTRQPCSVPVVQLKSSTGYRWPIERSELIAVVLALVLIGAGWTWARRERPPEPSLPAP